MTLKVKSNLVGGIAGVILSTIILLIIPSQIAMQLGDEEVMINQMFMPRLATIIMLIMSVIIIIQSVVYKKDNIVELKLNDELRTLLYYAVVVVIAANMNRFGFLASALCIVIFSFAYFRCKVIKYYLGSLVFVWLIYFCFNTLLKIPLP